MPFTRTVKGSLKSNGTPPRAPRAGKSTASTPGGEASISLATEFNEPPENIWEYALCIHGEKGVGKSSIGALLIQLGENKGKGQTFMLEPLRRNLRIKQIPKKGEPQLTWDRFKKYVDLFVAEEVRPCVDPIDNLYFLCIQHWCKKFNVKNLTDLKDRGAGWSEALKDFHETLNYFKNSGLMPIFTSHSRSRPNLIKGTYTKVDKDDSKEQPPETVQPTAPGAAWEYLRLNTDMAWYIGYRGTERVLHVRGAEHVWAGGGISEHFLQPLKNKKGQAYAGGGYPLEMIPLGRNPQEAYDNILASWNNELPGYWYDGPPEE